MAPDPPLYDPSLSLSLSLSLPSPSAELQVVDGGQHFLSASDPGVVNAAAVEFIGRWA